MADTNRKTELQQIVSKAQSELWDIESQGRDKQNAAAIGKCFRYRNSFGSDEGWWLYLKILRVDDGNLIAHRFQTDVHGRMETEPEYSIFHELGGGYDEIVPAEFAAAWEQFKAAVTVL